MPFKPVVAIRSSASNISDLRTRVVRERLLPIAPNTWGLVREVIEAAPSPSVMALTIEVGEVEP